MGGSGRIKRGVICEKYFRWKDKVEDLVEVLNVLRIKEVRVTRHASRARKHSPVYHSMSRGGCQGEYAPGWHLGAGEDRVGQAVRAQRRQRRGTRGEMSANEQKRAEVSKGKCETREGRNGLKKLIRTNPHRAQKRV